MAAPLKDLHSPEKDRDVMLAAVFERPGKMAVKEIPIPRIESELDVLIEVEACGICGSDVHMLEVPPGHPGKPETVLGHEFVGRVAAMGPSVQGLTVGQRVVADPDPKCGVCEGCRAGRPGGCQHMVHLGHFRDGALARYTTIPGTSVFPVSEEVPAELAAITEPLACVVNGVRLAGPKAGDSVVVFGAGSIGCMFTAVLRNSGAYPIIVVEPSVARHGVAKAVGADVVVTPEALEDAVKRFIPSGASIVIDAVGSVFAHCISAAAAGGRVVLIGMNDNAKPAIHQVDITTKSLTILGSYSTNFTFPAAIRLIESGRLPLRELVTDVLPLEKTAEGIARLKSGEAVKIVIRP